MREQEVHVLTLRLGNREAYEQEATDSSLMQTRASKDKLGIYTSLRQTRDKLGIYTSLRQTRDKLGIYTSLIHTNLRIYWRAQWLRAWTSDHCFIINFESLCR